MAELSRHEQLSEVVEVRLSLSDWLLLVGWCSAGVTDATPRVINNCIYAIAKQVREEPL